MGLEAEGVGACLCHALSPALQIKRNTWDESELKQSGLHSAVRFLSVALALKASLIPISFFSHLLSLLFSFFALPAHLLLFLCLSSEFTLLPGPGCKNGLLTSYYSHWLKSFRNAPMISSTSIWGGTKPHMQDCKLFSFEKLKTTFFSLMISWMFWNY